MTVRMKRMTRASCHPEVRICQQDGVGSSLLKVDISFPQTVLFDSKTTVTFVLGSQSLVVHHQDTSSLLSSTVKLKLRQRRYWRGHDSVISIYQGDTVFQNQNQRVRNMNKDELWMSIPLRSSVVRPLYQRHKKCIPRRGLALVHQILALGTYQG